MEYAYLISGVHRSGTSMMMRCIEAAGFEAVFDHQQDVEEHYRPTNDYHPNPNGFYQPSELRFHDPDFYQMNKGKAIKCDWRRLTNLPEGHYRVIFMLRKPDEILRSMKSFDKYYDFGSQEVVAHLYDAMIPRMIEHFNNLPNIELITLDYNKIMEDPAEEFEKLDAWGIKSTNMVPLVERKLYRSHYGNTN